MYLKRRIGVLLKLAISVVLICVACRNIDGGGIVARLRSAQQRRRAGGQNLIASAIEYHVAVRRPQLQLKIRIRALREQHLGDFERRGLVGGRSIGTTARGQRR